jgi:hypothetical protein
LSEGIKDKALRYRNLAKDETFQELIETVANRQVAVFLNVDSSVEAIDEARSIVLALKYVDTVIQSVLDEEAVYDKKNS